MSAINFPWKYQHVAVDAQVSAGSCVLHSITINRTATAGDFVTVYDSPTAGGAVVAIIGIARDSPAYVTPTTLLYDCQLKNGLYIEFDQAPADADLTVVYK
jgi:hypothetical protein